MLIITILEEVSPKLLQKKVTNKRDIVSQNFLDTLIFNAENLEDTANEVNIIFHDEEYLSPDNCAIYINHSYQYLTFGLLTAYKIHPDQNYKLFAAM